MGFPKKNFIMLLISWKTAFLKKNLNKKNLRKKLNLKNKKIVIFVGKLIDRKNPHDFLKLAHKFQNNKRIHFLIIGSGELNFYCKKFYQQP